MYITKLSFYEYMVVVLACIMFITRVPFYAYAGCNSILAYMYISCLPFHKYVIVVLTCIHVHCK